MKKKRTIVSLLILLSVLASILILKPFKKQRLVHNTFPDANVILILIDTLRADHLGCYGYNRNTSPVIDKLAQKGIRFPNMLAQASWTRPGAASIMTGLFPKNHQANTSDDNLAEEIDLLPEILQRHGYATYGFNPNGNAGQDIGFDQGYTLYSACQDEREPGENFPVDSDEVNRALFKSIKQITNPKKNFIYVHYMDPHPPYIPKEKHFSKSNTSMAARGMGYDLKIPNMIPQERKKVLEEMVNAYDDGILFNDKMIGQLFCLLKKKKMFSNSIIIVTSDHGEEFFEHQGFFHGRTLFDEQLRVPLIISLPDKTNMELDKIANQVDILPTVLTLLDIPVPKNIDGIDLFKHVERQYSHSELDLNKKQRIAIQTKHEKLIQGTDRNFGWFRRSVLIEIDDHYLALKIKSSYVYRRIHVMEEGKIIRELKISPRKKTFYIPLGKKKKHHRILIKSAKPPPVPEYARFANHRKYHSFYLYNSVNVKDKNIKGEPMDEYYSLNTDPVEQINLIWDNFSQNTIMSLKDRLKTYILKRRNLNLTKTPVKMNEDQLKQLEALGYI